MASHDGGERWPDGADAARWPLALIVVLAFALAPGAIGCLQGISIMLSAARSVPFSAMRSR